jgi:multisubunit Na+/H+ antiporter MnhB subunit
MGPKTKHRVFVRLLQFFVLGVLIGITEDLLAIHFATEAKITWDVVKVAFLIAFPFAIINEILVDLKIFRRLLNNNSKKKRGRN